MRVTAQIDSNCCWWVMWQLIQVSLQHTANVVIQLTLHIQK